MGEGERVGEEGSEVVKREGERDVEGGEEETVGGEV